MSTPNEYSAISANENTTSGSGLTASRLPRRTLLKAAGAATLVTAAGAAVAQPAGAEELRKNFDVIVVGAGLAGVTAARELRAQGKRVLLLEARDRIGGRTWTDTYQGQQIERGGAWVDPLQPYVWRELNRYSIPVVADAGVERSIMPTLDGFQEYDPAEAYARQKELFTPFFEDGNREYFERPYEPLHREDLVRRHDGFSLRDRLDQMRYAPEEEIRLTSTTSLYGGSSERGALTHLTQWWALSGWNFDGFHGVNTYRPKNGTISLLRAILAEAAPTLCLNSPVAAVKQDGNRVCVITRDGRRFVAPEVIMAVPVNVWKTIEFTPGLPEAHRTASAAGIGVPHEKKLWLDLRRPADRFVAEAPEGHPICIMGRFDEGQPVVAFSVKDTFDVRDRGQVEAAVKDILPEAELLDYTANDWHADEFALGVGAFRQPFQLTRLHRDIQKPHGRVKFAGGDIADGWSGYMDGAVESGIRVAGGKLLTAAEIERLTSSAALHAPRVDRRLYRSMSAF
ncbi:FAD-dependent oxidoreductase [Streptomyces verrucosisporus]|uniref:flavin monoamine oxidase family protein n=1 Tax=Streptomyces verrucosisporus TaxID=1695161 RepID=UPI0019D1EAA3|nr:NAD(P)/FAD-dependent oxidoreductase [Streptomyces verrucosisporus]MBN3932602.1 FAD-dependent oxidoreductase [Streptomyces verrucosisporus]